MMSILLPLVLAAAPAAEKPDVKADVKAEADAWHRDRISRLKAPDGWLTLVNLVWLDEGETTVGSREGAGVQLPQGAPSSFGTFRREGKTVSFTPDPKVQVQAQGRPFSGGVVSSPERAEPIRLEHGTLSFVVLERGDRIGVRVKDSSAPTRTRFTGIDRFEPTPAWHKHARWEPAAKGESVRIPNVLGDTSTSPAAGTAVFTHEGKEYRLVATQEGDQLFFIFGDQTNRDATYGAGRFLYTALPKGERVVLDFNRAYNPPCAFTAYATCPLPPSQNKLKVRVEAGEKRYEKPKP